MDNSKKIAELQAQIVELQNAQSTFNSLHPDAKLAIELHTALCRWNHTDGCAWFYEVHQGVDDWTGQAHARWLSQAKKARGLLEGFSDDGIVRVVRAIQQL